MENGKNVLKAEGRENLLVSFSDGETSAFMAQWIQKHLEDKVYKNVVYVFANTGLENEETLRFIKQCDEYFGFNTKWIQARTRLGRKSTSYWHIDFETAARSGQPFEEIIQKYGIPNQSFPHCTRELKQNPIKAFARDYFGGEKYDTAIGIRADEADRMNAKAKEMGFIYPLINRDMIPTTKPMVNFFWKQMPFRLELKGYQGNCKTCWKKADKKLFQIAKEDESAFDFMASMEERYPRVGAEFLKDETCKDRVFFRGNRTAKQIVEQSKSFDGTVKDDSIEYQFQTEIDLIGGESCEVFSECGS